MRIEKMWCSLWVECPLHCSQTHNSNCPHTHSQHHHNHPHRHPHRPRPRPHPPHTQHHHNRRRTSNEVCTCLHPIKSATDTETNYLRPIMVIHADSSRRPKKLAFLFQPRALMVSVNSILTFIGPMSIWISLFYSPLGGLSHFDFNFLSEPHCSALARVNLTHQQTLGGQ